MPNIIQEKTFAILENENKDLMIMIKSHSLNPATDPEIIYDGKTHAILFRDNDTTIILDYISEGMRDKIFNSDKILITEYEKDNSEESDAIIINEYYANIVKVKKVPLNENNIITIEDIKESEDIKTELKKYFE